MTNNERSQKEENRLQKEANRRVWRRVVTFQGINAFEFVLSCTLLSTVFLFSFNLYVTIRYLFGG